MIGPLIPRSGGDRTLFGKDEFTAQAPQDKTS